MPRARNTNLVKAFSKVLKEERVNKKLTQEELAFRADVDRTFIGLLESEKRQPSLSVLFAISGALGVSPHTVVTKIEKQLAGSSEHGDKER